MMSIGKYSRGSRGHRSLGLWRGCIFFIVCMLTFAPLYGQQEEVVRAKFCMLSWAGPIRDLVYFDKGTPVPLQIANGAPGPYASYVGPPELAFYRPGVDAEGKLTYREVGVVTLPSHLSDMLLLFIPLEQSDGYRIFSLSAEAEAFTTGSFCFSNFTGKTVAIKAGDHLVNIQPGASRVISPEDVGKTNVNVQMASDSAAEGWKLIYSSRWASLGQRRAWVFIYQDAAGSTSIRKYYQSPPPSVPQSSHYERN